MRLLVTASEGTAQLVADECKALKLRVSKVRYDGVELIGGFKDLSRLLVWSRVGERVLIHLHSFAATNSDDLYDGSREVPWLEWVDSTTTVGVTTTGRLPGNRQGQNALRNHVFASQRVKDAMVDTLRERYGHRPDVERRDPDVQVVTRFFGDRCNIYLDASGAPLHRRGYRFSSVAAPLSETLAAAMLADCGFKPGTRLHDPLCGSGTIAIEAALIQAGMAPNAERAFGIERWALRRADARKWLDVARSAARQVRRKLDVSEPPTIVASDIDERAVEVTRKNARGAGVEHLIRIEQADARKVAAPQSGTLVVCNVPYGERIGDDVTQLYAELGQQFATFASCRVAVLSGHEQFLETSALQPCRNTGLRNGRLHVTLHHFSIAVAPAANA